jgi:hypothetical protein
VKLLLVHLLWKLSALDLSFDVLLFANSNLTTIDESGSLLSPSDISYDRTEEDLDGTRAHTGRSSKRRSTQAGDEENEVILSGKRSRRDVVSMYVVESTRFWQSDFDCLLQTV